MYLNITAADICLRLHPNGDSVQAMVVSDYNFNSVRVFTFEYEFLHLACNHWRDCYNDLYKRL